jgi:taurine dioxygenase
MVSNVAESGVAIGSLGAGELGWHTDMSYREDLHKASTLYALEVPAAGGNTSFCAECATLPTSLKARCAGLWIKYKGTYNSGSYVREGLTATDDPRNSPCAIHPLVCRHPESGRQSLYLVLHVAHIAVACGSYRRSASDDCSRPNADAVR